MFLLFSIYLTITGTTNIETNDTLETKTNPFIDQSYYMSGSSCSPADYASSSAVSNITEKDMEDLIEANSDYVNVLICDMDELRESIVNDDVSTHPCYQLYYLDVLKCHIAVNKIVENTSIWEYMSRETKEKICDLLSFRHTHSQSAGIQKIKDGQTLFSALFIPKHKYITNGYISEDKNCIKVYNRNLITEMLGYASKIDYKCGNERIYKLLLNFMLNELMAVIKQEAVESVAKYFDPPSFDSQTNIELMMCLYAFFSLYDKDITVSHYDNTLKEFTDQMILLNNQDICFICEICKKPLTKNTFIIENSILQLKYCDEHRESNYLIILKNNQDFEKSSLTNYLFHKIDYLNLKYDCNASNANKECETTNIITYNKKMTDMIRYIINENFERGRIIHRIKKIIDALPGIQFHANILLTRIIEFELQHTDKFNDVIDDQEVMFDSNEAFDNNMPLLKLADETGNDFEYRAYFDLMTCIGEMDKQIELINDVITID